MNPLLATCGVGLLTMTVGAALTPDVLPTPVQPPALTPDAPVVAAAAPDAPPSRPTVIEAEEESIRLDPEMFSRRALPTHELPPAVLTRIALGERIVHDVMTPLRARAVELSSFSRVRLPRTDYQYEFDATEPKRVKAPKTDYVAFRVTQKRHRRPLDEATVVALGRIHQRSGQIELRFPADKAEVWHPLDAGMKRLGALR